jgi:hypothetical protein
MTYSIPDSVKFAWEGFTYYENWADHNGPHADVSGGLAELRRCGLLAFRTPASEQFVSKVIAAYDDVDGLDYELWDADKMRGHGFAPLAYAPAS